MIVPNTLDTYYPAWLVKFLNNPTWVYWRVGQRVHGLVRSTQFCWTGRSLAIKVTPFQSWKVPQLGKKKKCNHETIRFNVLGWNQSRLCCAPVTNCLCDNIDDSNLQFELLFFDMTALTVPSEDPVPRWHTVNWIKVRTIMTPLPPCKSTVYCPYCQSTVHFLCCV